MRIFEPGAKIAGRYEIIRPLARGGMGGVYLAKQFGLERIVAIKFFDMDDDDVSEAQRKMFFDYFRHEAAAHGHLNHPNIIRAYDYGEHEDTPYLVMEYFESAPVLKWGKETKPNLLQWLAVGRQIALGLEHAHSFGILHRDVKNGNVLCRGPVDVPEVKLIDWGIALQGGRTRLTSVGGVVGTPGATIDPMVYLDPKFRPVPQSDFYAFGMLLYSALCGARALDVTTDANPHTITKKAAANVIRPPHEHNPAVTGDLEEFLIRLTKTNPEERPPSARAIIKIIDTLSAGEPVDFAKIYQDFPLHFPQFSVAQPADDLPPTRPASASFQTRPSVGSGSESVISGSKIELIAEGPSRVRGLSEVRTPPELSSVEQRLEAFHAQLAQPRQRSRAPLIAALVALALLAGGAITYAALGPLAQQQRAAVEKPESNTPLAVSPHDLEDSSKPAGPALDRILEKRPGFADEGASVNLNSFDPNVTAHYPATLPTGPYVPQQGVAHASKNGGHAEHAPAAAEEPAFTISIGTSAHKEAKLAYGQRARGYLLENLDTSLADAVKIQLRESVRSGDSVLIPARSVLVGHASMGHDRAQVSFDKAIFPDGNEMPLVAVAVTEEGADGLSMGRFAYGAKSSDDSAGTVVGGVARDVASGAINQFLPGSDVLSGAGTNAANRQISKAKPDDQPKERDRFTLKKGSPVLIEFRQRPSK